MKTEQIESRIQEIRRILMGENTPHGDDRVKLLEELHNLELKLNG